MNMKQYQPKFHKIKSMPIQATWATSCPFKKLDAAFNWINEEYPVLHTHTHWEILLIINGKIKHTLNGKASLLFANDICIIRPNDRHKLEYEKKSDAKDYQSITFIFTNELFSKLIAPFPDINLYEPSLNLTFSIEGELLNYVVEQCLSAQLLSREKYRNISTIIIQRLLLNYFEKNVTYISIYPNWLNEFISYISSPSHFDKSIKELSEYAPYSYSRLNILFKNYTGKTLLAYINDLKLLYAKRLLRTTNKQVLEISNVIYYDSVSSFNHNFKKKFGVTPTEYRKNEAQTESPPPHLESNGI